MIWISLYNFHFSIRSMHNRTSNFITKIKKANLKRRSEKRRNKRHQRTNDLANFWTKRKKIENRDDRLYGWVRRSIARKNGQSKTKNRVPFSNIMYQYRINLFFYISNFPFYRLSLHFISICVSFFAFFSFLFLRFFTPLLSYSHTHQHSTYVKSRWK